MRRLITALCFLPMAARADGIFDSSDAEILQQALIQTADAFVLPNYQAQADAAETLKTSLASFCETGTNLDEAREDYATLFLAWQRASLIQIGQVMEDEGPFRFQLWPDPKGFARRAIRNATRTADTELLSVDALAEQSVALRNLSTLERLVFSELEANSFTCNLAIAVTGYQQREAESLVSDWTPGSEFRAEFDGAFEGNARYENVDAVARELLSGSVVYIDRLRKFKILRGLGEEAGRTRIERSEARAGGLGLASIVASMDALADLYALENGFFESAEEIGATQDANFLARVLKDIAGSLAQEGDSLDAIYTEDGDLAEELRSYAKLMSFHDEFLKVDFPSSIGLTAGFTSADGD